MKVTEASDWLMKVTEASDWLMKVRIVRRPPGHRRARLATDGTKLLDGEAHRLRRVAHAERREEAARCDE